MAQEWKPATGVIGLRAGGGNRARRMGANPNPAPSMLETAMDRLATTEVNVGLRPRTTLTAPGWSALIEHVE